MSKLRAQTTPAAVGHGELAALLASLDDVAVAAFDRHLRLVWSSGADLSRIGVRDSIPPWLEGHCRAALAGENVVFEIDGSGRQPARYEIKVAPLDRQEDSAPSGLLIVRDVTGRLSGPVGSASWRILDDRRRGVVCAVDDTGTIEYISPASVAAWGRHPDEIVGRSIHDLLSTEEAASLPPGGAILLFPFDSADSIRLDQEISSPLVRLGAVEVDPWAHTPTLANLPFRDRSHPARGLQESFRRSLQQAPVPLALFDLAADGVGEIVMVNGALAEMLGHPSHSLVGRPLRAFIHPEDLAISGGQMYEELQAGSVHSSHREQRLLRADGQVIWALVSLSVVWDEEGIPLHGIAQFDDISERKRAEERMSMLALHDPVTGLASRSLLMERLAVALERARRRRRHVGVIYVDVDGFKHTNDSLGHAAGDLLLKAIATRLQQTIRPGDTAARLGGDEFVILCDDAGGEEGMSNLAERILAVVQPPFYVGDHEIMVSVSIGMALATDQDAPENLIRNANQAMYWAKEKGRSRHEMFSSGPANRKSDYLSVESGLRRAIDNGELRVFYQPLVNLASRRIVGMEALVRWQHPDRGLLLPGEFLDVAEESRLITGVSALVLREACRQGVAWQRRGLELGVSVNVSASEIGSSLFVATLRRTLAETGLPPASLCLELTESVLFQATDSGLRHIRDLTEMGVKLALDDFGTAFASLDYVRRFPIDRIKIDHSFIAGIVDNPRDQSIAAGILALAEAISVEVVAEGIETAEQLERLMGTGCRLAQGFYLGTPQPAEVISGMILSGAGVGSGAVRGPDSSP